LSLWPSRRAAAGGRGHSGDAEDLQRRSASVGVVANSSLGRSWSTPTGRTLYLFKADVRPKSCVLRRVREPVAPLGWPR